MRPIRCTLAAIPLIAMLMAASFAWASTGSAMQRKRHPKPVVKTAPAAAPEIPAAPPPPTLPKDEPAVAPEVSYTNGRLTIMARNSTLSDVLKEVEKHTGATFEISSGDTHERVVGLIGPGPARDVLATLLNGSHFNYVMLSPLDDPSALSRVLLTPREAAVPETYNAQQQPQQFIQPVQISPALQLQQQQMAQAEQSTDNGAETQDDADAQAQDQPDGQPDAQTDGTQPGVPQTPGVKTPEQLLQELRQQQQQIQQQVPQGANPNENR